MRKRPSSASRTAASRSALPCVAANPCSVSTIDGLPVKPPRASSADVSPFAAADLGYVFAAGGIGAVAAAVVMAQRGQPRRDVTFMYVCWTIATLAVAGYGLSRTTIQLMLVCLVFNALETMGTIVWSTIKQRHVPSTLLGRVSSIDWLISVGLLPLSFALTGPAAGLVGVRATLVGAAVIGGAVTLAALFLPGMRSIEGDASSAPELGPVAPATG
jgi:hypothetical protein